MKLEKIKLENSIKMLPLGKNPEWGQALVTYPFGHDHFTKNGKIPFFTQFDAKHFLLNFKILLDMF